MVEFRWDENKEAKNFSKHGIHFSLAALVFNDPALVSQIDNRQDYGEERWVSVGMPIPQSATLLHVTHTYQESPNGKEIVRIISARKATNREAKRYFRTHP